MSFDSDVSANDEISNIGSNDKDLPSPVHHNTLNKSLLCDPNLAQVPTVSSAAI